MNVDEYVKSGYSDVRGRRSR